MTGNEMDDLLRSLPSGGAEKPVDPAVMEQIRRPILASLTPVRPLRATSVLAGAFCLLFGLGTALGSFLLGFKGLRLLSPEGRVGVCGLLLVLVLGAGFALALSMHPGGRRVSGWVLPTITVLAFEALFALLLKDYALGTFVRSGLICLGIGLLCAAPAAVLAYFLLRTGYVVAPISTGLALGAGAGLVGLAVIEFHCPIQTFPHVAVWHTGIVLLSVAVGALFAALSRAK